MSEQKCGHVKVFDTEIVQMKESGKTKREIAEQLELITEQIKELLKRFRRRERKLTVSIIPRSKGRPRKRPMDSKAVFHLMWVIIEN